MWFYVIVFLYCVLALSISNRIKQDQKKFFEISSLIILCIISGTRYYLGGTDYYVYKIVFDELPNIQGFISNYYRLHDIYRTFGFESGYLLYNSLIKSLGFNFYGFTLINSIVFYASLYKGFKKYSNNFNLVIIVFLYKLFFYATFISMRQSMSIVIFILALRFIEEKRPVKYFLLSALAFTFHNSALLLFPIYFINKVDLTKRKIIIANIIFIPTLAVSLLNLPVMKLFDFIIRFFENPASIVKAEALIMGEALSSIGMFHTLEYFLIMILLIIYFDKIRDVDEHSEFILKLFLLLLPIFTLFRGYEILTRTKDYFILTYAIILGYICQIDKCKRFQVIQIGTIIVCAFGFFRFIMLFDGGAMAPYESFLFKDITIFD